MALPLSLLTALVLCCYGSVGSLGCHLPQNSVLLSKKTFALLGQMRKTAPLLCLKDRRNFLFPQKMITSNKLQKAQSVSVLKGTLQQILTLFGTELASAAWNSTVLDKLHSVLHQQLEITKTCLVQIKGEEQSVPETKNAILALQRYFLGIRLYLEEKKYSDCAWEIVRVEIMRAFSSSAKLQKRIRSKDGAVERAQRSKCQPRQSQGPRFNALYRMPCHFGPRYAKPAKTRSGVMVLAYNPSCRD